MRNIRSILTPFIQNVRTIYSSQQCSSVIAVTLTVIGMSMQASTPKHFLSIVRYAYFASFELLISGSVMVFPSTEQAEKKIN